MKRVLSLVLSFVIIVSMCTSVFAVSPEQIAKKVIIPIEFEGETIYEEVEEIVPVFDDQIEPLTYEEAATKLEEVFPGMLDELNEAANVASISLIERLSDVIERAPLFIEEPRTYLNVELVDDGMFQYEDNGDIYIIRKYIGEDEMPMVPTEYNGKEVIIGRTYYTGTPGDTIQGVIEGPFANDTKITGVIIMPETRVEENNASYMFFGCTSLESTPELNNNVTASNGTYYNCTGLTSVTPLPAMLEEANFMFYNCSSLSVMPDLTPGLKYLVSAFEGCSSMPTMTELPSNIINIDSAFKGCILLPTLPTELPLSVENISEAWSGCTNISGDLTILDNVDFAKDVFKDTIKPITLRCTNNAGASIEAYPGNVNLIVTGMIGWKTKVVNNTLLGERYIGKDTIVNVPSVYLDKQFVIGNTAFTLNQDIEEVHFADGVVVESLNQPSMFKNCVLLTTVTNLPDSIKNLQYGFQGCVNLVNPIDLPTSLEEADYLYDGCTALTGAGVLPDTIRTLGFTYKGTAIVAPPVIPTNTKLMWGTFEGCKFMTGNLTLPAGLTYCEGVFPSTELPINCYYYVENKLAFDMPVPLNVTKIAIGKLDYDFIRNADGSYTLTKYTGNKPVVNVPETWQGGNVAYHPTTIFRGNKTITSVTFPAKSVLVTLNGNYMFYGCNNLESVSGIPYGIYTMNYGFYNCANLTQAPDHPSSVSNALYMYNGCTSLTETSDITNIVDATSMYRGCTSLTTVNGYFDKVTKANYIFYGCTSLEGTIKFGSYATTFIDVFANTVKPILLEYSATNNIIRNAVVPANVTKSEI